MIFKELKGLIDKAVSRDFIIHEITNQDKENDSYRALNFTLSFNNIKIEYIRKVESRKHPIIPRYQFLFGFLPKDGLCLLVNKEAHKAALCDGPLDQLNNTCLLLQSLLYLLVPTNKFEVYSYLPACCEINCPNSPRQYHLRSKLWK